MRAILIVTLLSALAGEAAAAPQPEQAGAGDRRGRIAPRSNPRINDRVTPRAVPHWTNPVARTRSDERRFASTPSEAITYGREYRPR